ncbi:hypothetical protein CC2G_008256 [Coprinopsis cinerea AmutBmut pab1-1]|nr:hypothetical protein CC2G_008256 [Coprinopsis cinerea AmutBmut pab1-1]
MADDGRRTTDDGTDDERTMADDGRRTTDDERTMADDGRRTMADDGPRTTDDERTMDGRFSETTDDGRWRTTDDERTMADDGRRTTDDGGRWRTMDGRFSDVEEYRPSAKRVDIVANWENIARVERRYSPEVKEYRVGRVDIPEKGRNIEGAPKAPKPVYSASERKRAGYAGTSIPLRRSWCLGLTCLICVLVYYKGGSAIVCAKFCHF